MLTLPFSFSPATVEAMTNTATEVLEAMEYVLLIASSPRYTFLLVKDHLQERHTNCYHSPVTRVASEAEIKIPTTMVAPAQDEVTILASAAETKTPIPMAAPVLDEAMTLASAATKPATILQEQATTHTEAPLVDAKEQATTHMAAPPQDVKVVATAMMTPAMATPPAETLAHQTTMTTATALATRREILLPAS